MRVATAGPPDGEGTAEAPGLEDGASVGMPSETDGAGPRLPSDGEGDGMTPAFAGSPYESRPAVMITTPSAIKSAGMSRVKNERM